MQIFRHFSDFPAALKGGVVVIGNFDGLHKGHLLVLEQARIEAQKLKAPLIMLTFEPHPRHLFQPDAPPWRVLPFAEKARRLEALGIDAILAQRFNAAFAAWDADRFMQEILAEALAARCVMTGEDFVFGHQRSGNAQSLRDFTQAHGAMFFVPVQPLGNAGEGKFSSSKLREHLRQGEMQYIASMLGRPYSWCRRVVHGEARGRQIGFPTANLLPPPVMLPRLGVYAVEACWQDAQRQIKTALGVANLGVRPSFGQSRVWLEVHLLDLDLHDELYNLQMQVAFHHFLRDEIRFESIAALKTQIERDVMHAREVLKI